MLKDELTLIIVTYNSGEMISKCLDGIYGDESNIIIIDNASTDNANSLIAQKFPNVRIIKSEKNLGYGRAANLGLKEVKTPYALLLNPDVITSIGAIESLLERAKQNNSAAIYAPQTRRNKDDRNKPSMEKVDWVSGSVMLFDMSKFPAKEFFDENIFLFYEETDLCRRVISSGKDIIIFNDIYMDHLMGKSSGDNYAINYLKYWHAAWSRFYFNRKHFGAAIYAKKSSGYLLKYLFKLVLNIFSGNKRKVLKYKASLAGSLSFLIGLGAFDENGNPRAKPKS